MPIVLGRRPGGTGGGAAGLYDAWALLSDVKAANTAGGTFTQGAWRTRTLNTEIDPDGIVTLAANQFTLAAGTYKIAARAPAYSTNGARHKAKLADITGAADALIGSSGYCSADDQTDSWVIGRVVVAAPTVFELQHQIQVTEATIGFGVQSNFGVDEVYAQIEIWREA